VAIKTGISVTFSNSRTYSYTKGKTFSKALQVENEASKTVHIKVKDHSLDSHSDFLEKTMPDIANKAAAASSVVTAAIVTAGKLTAGDKEARAKVNTAAQVHAGLLAVGGISLLAATVGYNELKNGTGPKPKSKKEDQTLDQSASQLFMDSKSATIQTTGGKENKTSTITLEAKLPEGVPPFNDNVSNDPVMIKLERKKDDKGSIKLLAGGEENKGSSIRMDEKSLSLNFGGKSSIEILKDSIVFSVGDDKFTMDDKGLTIKKGDLSLTAGSIKKVKDIKASGDVDGAKVNAKGGKVGAVEG
jgi:hypothetical protein